MAAQWAVRVQIELGRTDDAQGLCEEAVPITADRMSEAPNTSDDQDMEAGPITVDDEDMEAGPITADDEDMEAGPITADDEDMEVGPITADDEDMEGPITADDEDMEADQSPLTAKTWKPVQSPLTISTIVTTVT